MHIEKTEDFIGGDEKIVLFKGISFNITGHLKNEKDMESMKISIKESGDATSSEINNEINN